MLGGLGVALAGAFLLRLVVGEGGSLGWAADPAVVGLRVSRAVQGVIVGAALAVAGVMLQSLLRNPLASPDLLGLGSGAGLGVMLGAYAASRAGELVVGPGASALPALAGSVGALALVYLMSQRAGLVEPVSLILVGVIVSLVCGAGTTLVGHLLPDGGIAASRLLMGALSDEVALTSPALWGVGAAVAGGLALGACLGPAMDAASLGEDEARSVGVRLGALRLTLFLAASVLTAGAVVLAGPIGFVGLVCPHAVRLLAGPSHRPLVLGAALAGAALVVGADILVRLVELRSGRLPISVLTALAGGPLFIVLLRREMAGRGE